MTDISQNELNLIIEALEIASGELVGDFDGKKQGEMSVLKNKLQSQQGIEPNWRGHLKEVYDEHMLGHHSYTHKCECPAWAAVRTLLARA